MGKRVNFIQIQNSSTVAAKGYQLLPFRTGYEQVIANRVDKLFASTAKQDATVISNDEHFVIVEYIDGTKDVIELGRKHGVVSGTTVPHNLISDLHPGQKIKAGDIIAFNDGFFTRDIFDEGMVSFKPGVLGTVALWESSDTIEDGCVIFNSLTDKLVTPSSTCKTLIVDFNTAVHNLVKIGDEVSHDSILCTLEDAVSASLTESDPEAIAALQQISASNPKAKTHGRVSNIEVVYYGDIEDMNSSLQSICIAADKKRAAKARVIGNGVAETGQIDESIHFGGIKLLEGNIGIKIFIDSELGITAGDKLVFANALKTTISRVDTNEVKAEDGRTVDAIFGYQSIANRIVYSPEISGTMNVILKTLSSEFVKIYRKG